MEKNPEAFSAAIIEALKTYDKRTAEELCKELVAFLYASAEEFPAKPAERIMQQLRNKRCFALMQQAGDALIQTGRSTLKIEKLYTQSLIDEGNYTAALSVLQDLVEKTRDNPGSAAENIEARGLIGRVYKQLYVNANNAASPFAREYLFKAVNWYKGVYDEFPAALWHGINVVACVCRVKKDGITNEDFPDAVKIATDILKAIEDKFTDGIADTWDFATATEACVALNKTDKVLEWLNRYIKAPYTDAFEIGSTLRQFKEVWQLNMNDEPGKIVLPILQAELLSKEGGQVSIDKQDIEMQKVSEGEIAFAYEKVFGPDSFETYGWYMLGAERCLSIVRIGRDASKGWGTGFIMKGADLHAKLGDDLVVLTNAHVLSDDPNVFGCLRSDEACVLLEVLDKEKTFGVGDIIFSSPPAEYDVTIFRIAKTDTEAWNSLTTRLKAFFPVARALPLLQDAPRVYIIGHPAGGTLSISLQDNLLLDHQDPLLHYRTPTEGGSSGSPVFNRQWQLIGIHHKGGKAMPMLNGKPGTYEANEGVWIRAIINELAKQLDAQTS